MTLDQIIPLENSTKHLRIITNPQNVTKKSKMRDHYTYQTKIL
jgi:hypothetical protein